MNRKAATPPLVDEETGEVLATPAIWNPVPRESPFWKTPYNHDTDAEARASALICRDASKTNQSMAADADINNILAKFLKTGDPALLNPSGIQPNFADVSDGPELVDLLNQRIQVQDAWEALPTAAKAILHTPEKFVEWYDNCVETGNVQGLRDIGLLPPEKPSTTPKAAEGGSPAPTAAKDPGAPAPGST